MSLENYWAGRRKQQDRYFRLAAAAAAAQLIAGLCLLAAGVLGLLARL